MEPLELVAAVVPMTLLVRMATLEARRLATRAQRLRELEHEGLEQLLRSDAFPEFAARTPSIGLPDGRRISREGLLAREARLVRGGPEG